MLGKIFKYLIKLKATQTGNILLQAPVVVAIAGSLTLGGSTLANDWLSQARDARRAADTHQVTQALALYYSDHTAYPLFYNSGVGSWKYLQTKLEPEYIYNFPTDPDQSRNYSYWSDGQQVKITYFSEISGETIERWLN